MQHENPKSREQGTDKPGRFNDGPHVQRSAMDETDRHQLEKVRFARAVATFLNESVRTQTVTSIVLVAPPTILGELRDSLHPEAREHVLAEIDKLLTNHSLDAIQRIVLES